MRGKPRERQVTPHLTYMIAELLIDNLDVTKYRGYGLGDRDPSTLPGRKTNAESDWENVSKSGHWRSLRKWADSTSSVGLRY